MLLSGAVGEVSQAQASCLSISGLDFGTGCTSAPFSVAIGLGPTAKASAHTPLSLAFVCDFPGMGCGHDPIGDFVKAVRNAIASIVPGAHPTRDAAAKKKLVDEMARHKSELAKQKADLDAARKKQDDDAAAAKLKADQDAAAKKKADQKAAAAKKKIEDDLAAADASEQRAIGEAAEAKAAADDAAQWAAEAKTRHDDAAAQASAQIEHRDKLQDEYTRLDRLGDRRTAQDDVDFTKVSTDLAAAYDKGRKLVDERDAAAAALSEANDKAEKTKTLLKVAEQKAIDAMAAKKKAEGDAAAATKKIDDDLAATTQKIDGSTAAKNSTTNAKAESPAGGSHAATGVDETARSQGEPTVHVPLQAQRHSETTESDPGASDRVDGSAQPEPSARQAPADTDDAKTDAKRTHGATAIDSPRAATHDSATVTSGIGSDGGPSAKPETRTDADGITKPGHDDTAGMTKESPTPSSDAA